MYKKSLFFIVLMFTVLFLSACSKNDENVPQVAPLKIAFASWPGFDIVYYAKVKHIFEKNGVDIELLKYSDQLSVRKALQALEVDGAMISIWDVANLRGNNSFEIILSTNVSHGADGIVAQKGISSVKELKGKRVSLQVGSVNELILLEALQFHGMDRGDVIEVDLTNDEAMPKLFHKNIDAAVVWEPLLSKAKRKIDGNIIFSTKEVDSQVIDTLVVSAQSLKSKKEQWHKYVKSWFEIMNALEETPDDVYEVVSKEIIDASFARDYGGLLEGNIELNKEMFENKRLEKSLHDIYQLTNNKNRATILINDEFVKPLFH